ncbi:MAG: hypothetical protein IJE44_04770 [Clostridia bacterium]|nr:hypothetical protein [Clostridia bacterium]
MKKILYIFIAVVLVLALGGVLYHTFFVNAPVENERITQEEAEKLCASVLGEKDEETGFPFSFGATGTIQKDGKEYYVIRTSWLVNNDHLSYIGDFFVTTDGKEIYDGWYTSEEYSIGKLIWSE